MPNFFKIDPKGLIHTKEEFIAECVKAGVADADKEKLFFIFPSNIFPQNKHHTDHGATLFSNKSGGGLAALSATLGNAGIATLGLPSTGIGRVDDVASLPPIAKDAVADIWTAVGFGLKPVLAVRDFDHHVVNVPPKGNGNGNKYFSQPLAGGDNKEPRFYGDNEATPNLVLANYYVEQLNLLQQFLALDEQARIAFIDNPPAGITPEIITAYKKGVTAKSAATKPVWFAKTPQAAPAPSTTTPAVSSSPIKYGEPMEGKDVITAIKGYMLLAGKNVKGVLVEHGLVGTISMTNLSDNDFAAEFIKLIKEAQTQLVEGQTRIIIPVHLGDHYATVAIDVSNNTAVIVEPTNGYKKEVTNIERLLKQVFNNPEINVQHSQTKIQENDSFSCGLIASNLAGHLLSCDLSIAEAINEQNLPKILYPLNTEQQKQALVADVQNAHRIKTNAIKKKDLAYDGAVQAMLLGIFNLVATNQLDDDTKYSPAKFILLNLYKAYLQAENNGKAIDDTLVTWPNFKQFLLGKNTAEAQKQLAERFTDLWRGQFLGVLENPAVLEKFQSELYAILEKEFKDFLDKKPNDGKEKNYERFSYIKKAFIRLKQDTTLGDQKAKLTAFKNWWQTQGKDQLITHYRGTDEEGKTFPSEFDLRTSIAILRGIDFDLGIDASDISNKYTPGYGEILPQDLGTIFSVAHISQMHELIKDLCNRTTGVFNKGFDQDSNPIYKFRKMSDADRENKLQAILWNYVSDDVIRQDIMKKLLAQVNPKQPHPTLALTKQGDQWNIVDNPNSTWLKIRTFNTELPTTPVQTPAPDAQDSASQDSANTVTTPKIEFQNNPIVLQKLKDICEELATKNAGKNYQVVSNDKVNVNGDIVNIVPTGFEYKKVTQEIIEFAVKAMSEIFTQQGLTDPSKRIVKLTLTPENEKFRKAYKDELKKYNLTLEEDAASTLQMAQPRDTHQKWRDMQEQHTADQAAAGQQTADQQSASPPAAPTVTPTGDTPAQPAAPLSSGSPASTPASPAAPAAASSSTDTTPKTAPLTGSASGSLPAEPYVTGTSTSRRPISPAK